MGHMRDITEAEMVLKSCLIQTTNTTTSFYKHFIVVLWIPQLHIVLLYSCFPIETQLIGC